MMEHQPIPVKRLPQSLISLGETAFLREARSAMTAMSRPAIVFELPATAKLNNSAMDFLILCVRDAVEYDAAVAVVSSNREHQVILEITRLTLAVPVFASIEEATDHLRNCGKLAPGKLASVGDVASQPSPEPSQENNFQP